MTHSLRAALVLTALALLAWAGSCAVSLGMEGTTVYAAARQLAAWRASSGDPGPEAVARLASELEKAVEAAPGDANAEELLGRLASRQTARSGFLDAAVAHYARAVASRPTSPYTWAAIVEALYRKGNTGPRFWMALTRAAELGPQEPEVESVVVDYGLALWSEADSAGRRTVESTISAAMERGSPEILQVAERRGRLAVACRHLAEAPSPIEPRWLKLCSSWEGTT